MQKKFNFYEDPGHGWMACKKILLHELGIATKISSYSYQRGDMAYLEEDYDLGLFINAFQVKVGARLTFTRHATDRRSNIRGYEGYVCDSAYKVVATLAENDVNPIKECFKYSHTAAVLQAYSWGCKKGYWVKVYDTATGKVIDRVNQTGSAEDDLMPSYIVTCESTGNWAEYEEPCYRLTYQVPNMAAEKIAFASSPDCFVDLAAEHARSKGHGPSIQMRMGN